MKLNWVQPQCMRTIPKASLRLKKEKQAHIEWDRVQFLGDLVMGV
jgi:hypothetical protein